MESGRDRCTILAKEMTCQNLSISTHNNCITVSTTSIIPIGIAYNNAIVQIVHIDSCSSYFSYDVNAYYIHIYIYMYVCM